MVNNTLSVFTIFLILFLFLNSLSAQFLDSIKTSFNQKPSVDFKIDARNSFITNSLARIRGVKLGLNYGNRMRIGIGYNWLINSITREEGQKRINGVSIPYYSKLSFQYISPYIEYTFYQSKKWRISIPVLIGAGGARYRLDFPVTTKSRMQFVTLYEPYMTAEYKLFKYFSIGFGTGYRLILTGTNDIRKDLTSPIYVVNANVLFGDLYKRLVKKYTEMN